MRRVGVGRPLVLINPCSGGLVSFDPLLPWLAGRELWTYARRGYALSEVPVGSGRFADDVADLEAVMRAASGEVDVRGASYGATIALHAALNCDHLTREITQPLRTAASRRWSCSTGHARAL